MQTVPEIPASTEEREKLAQWAIMASLVVYKGQSVSAAYRAVYDTESECPASIRNNHKFRSLITRMRASQGMTDEEVKGTIESLYLSTVTDEDAPLKQRLQAAQQWQKLRGLEKIKPVLEVADEEIAWQRAMKQAKKVIDVEPENG